MVIGKDQALRNINIIKYLVKLKMLLAFMKKS
jgi:hypothetical protein